MSKNNNDLLADLWVFGYGSLMWDGWETQFQGICEGKAILRGYHRAFNKKSTRNWGTIKIPCPTLGLEKSNGAECVGLIFRFNNNQREAIVTYLNKREGPSFQLVEIEVFLEEGQKEMALMSINRSGRKSYIGNINFNNLVDLVRKARGENGSCFEYIQSIYLKCKELEIEDKYIQRLWSGINQGITTHK